MLMKIKWNVKKVIDIFMLPNISINNKPNGYKTMIVFQRLHKKDTLQFHINLTAKISMYIFNSRQTCCVCESLFCSMHLKSSILYIIKPIDLWMLWHQIISDKKILYKPFSFHSIKVMTNKSRGNVIFINIGKFNNLSFKKVQ